MWTLTRREERVRCWVTSYHAGHIHGGRPKMSATSGKLQARSENKEDNRNDEERMMRRERSGEEQKSKRKLKIESLLTTFRREKQKSTKRSGIGSDEVYESTWFAYKHMSFLLDKFTPRKKNKVPTLCTQNKLLALKRVFSKHELMTLVRNATRNARGTANELGIWLHCLLDSVARFSLADDIFTPETWTLRRNEEKRIERLKCGYGEECFTHDFDIYHFNGNLAMSRFGYDINGYNKLFGFRNNISTDDALINVTGKIINELDIGNKCLGIFLDLRKAFDTINHNLLLDKLHTIGVRVADRQTDMTGSIKAFRKLSKKYFYDPNGVGIRVTPHRISYRNLEHGTQNFTSISDEKMILENSFRDAITREPGQRTKVNGPSLQGLK
ncbi:hypothetical protein ANN_26777 [Periplaneta americana]|uniref:Reverse transcriptase domain-containing protein n=1 Tax=Periplaneta americana TaxID=6978 RepID=A0ABQ8RZ56_PERAM|nr:hypothetical protein ANN_26777 [Periplaneta americana]